MTLTDTVTVNGSHSAAGQWLTTHEALVRLGVSERTLFRRLAAGKLRRRTLEDGRVQVWLPLPSADRQVTVTSPETLSVGDRQVADDDRQPYWAENGHSGSSLSDVDGRPDPERALALLDRFNVALSRQLEPLIAEVRASRERNEELARENGQLTARVQALELELMVGTHRESTPSEIAPGGPSDHTPAEMTQTASAQPPRRPWWQWWARRPRVVG